MANDDVSNNIIYKFTIPEYHYKIRYLDPLLELYRYKLLSGFVKHIEHEIKSKFHKAPITYRKIYQYMSQLFMNVYTDLTYNAGKIVHLDDGLFNRCNREQTAQFYNDINYWCKQTIVNNDMFDIVVTIDNFIHKIKAFGRKLKSSNISNSYQITNTGNKIEFKFDTNTLKQFELNTIDMPIINITLELYERTKKFYVGDQSKYDNIILCLLLRYYTLGSGANQFVVDLDYKRELKINTGINFESFASVFNRSYDNFCSLFYDLEKPFGSNGSFMALNIQSGFYMCNPPYDEKLLDRMYQIVKRSLGSDDVEGVAFIMSIPKWQDYRLELDIDNDKLYHVKQVKHEKFHNPMDIKIKVVIPEYISYLFYNHNFAKRVGNDYINKLTKIFKEFKNL